MPGEIRITGEARTPQSVSNERDTGCVRAVFVTREIPAEERLNAECRQKCRFDEGTFQPDGVLLGKIAVRPAGDKCSYGFEWCLRFFPVHVVGSEYELIRFEGRLIPKADQSIVMRIGQAAEKN